MRNPLRRKKRVELHGWPGRIMDSLGFTDITNHPDHGYGSDNGSEMVRSWEHGSGKNRIGVASWTDGLVLVGPTHAEDDVNPATWSGLNARVWSALTSANDKPADAVVEVWDWRE